jgi:hypothetical protein
VTPPGSILDEIIQGDSDPDRPKAMAWLEYDAIVRRDWLEALNKPLECDLQRCLELHPCLLPVATTSDTAGGHGLWMEAVITQPPLAGFKKRVPDFMWFVSNSSTVTAVCLEIERSTKLWFKKNGTPTAELTQALDQLEEWRGWFAAHTKEELFDEYQLAPQWRNRHFKQHYALAYGRRSEFDTTAGTRHEANAIHLNQKRATMVKGDTSQMTLDALFPSETYRRLATIALRDNQLVAKSIPPTFETGEHVRRLARHVSGLEIAVDEMEHPPSPERLVYLKQRIAYWRHVPEWGMFSPISE